MQIRIQFGPRFEDDQKIFDKVFFTVSFTKTKVLCMRFNASYCIYWTVEVHLLNTWNPKDLLLQLSSCSKPLFLPFFKRVPMRPKICSLSVKFATYFYAPCVPNYV